MSVSATEGVTSGLMSLAGSSSADSTKATDDHDTFLQLLVAQLRYQDPMNPTDSSQFMAQNAQFTALEKMQDVADGMNSLLSAQLSFGSANMIGKQVTWVDADGATQSGTATGASFLSTGPVLTVNGSDVPIVSIISVGTPSTAVTSGAATPDSSTSTTGTTTGTTAGTTTSSTATA